MRIARPSSVAFYAALAFILGGGASVIGLNAVPNGAWWGLAPVLVVAVYALRQPWRRWQAAQQPFPDPWRRWLRRHVRLYRAAAPKAQRRFERDVQFFLREHAFEGVDGVAVTDERRLAVAAGAALLLHGRPDWELPAGRTILLYPDRFDDNYHGGAYADYDGMVHQQGPILLSARAVEESWANAEDGNNVVLHELAHLFDMTGAGADGVPSLVDRSSAAGWQALVGREMRRIRRGRSLLRGYGATAPSEFFATAVEVFFERPEALRQQHRELFDALAAFFNLDPRGRVAERDAEARGNTAVDSGFT